MIGRRGEFVVKVKTIRHSPVGNPFVSKVTFRSPLPPAGTSAKACAFTCEQLENLWGAVDDAVLEQTARRCRVKLFDDDEEEEEEEDDEPEQAEFPPPKRRREPKLGFWTLLGAALLGASGDGGHCTGDCAHCPPHFGYRYGRWYYGHGHVYGCEFGGNRGDGYD